MKLFLVIVALICNFYGVSALRCYNCTSNTLQITTGCHDPENLSSDFVVDCDPEISRCGVLRMVTEVRGMTVTQYARTCAPTSLNACMPHPMINGTNCFYTCPTDECNALNVFPYDADKSAATTPQASVEPKSTPEPESTPEPASSPEPKATPVPDIAPQPTESKDTTTTGGANQVHNKVQIVSAILSSISLFVLIK